MPVETIKEKFETSDGQRFRAKPEAERHEELIAAKEEYENALSKYNHALLQTQKTADGQPFKLGIFATYYYIHPNDFGLPGLRELPYLGWNFNVDERDKVTVHLREHLPGGDRFTQYRICDLYADKAAAELALLKAQKERLKEYAEQVKETEVRVTKRTS